MKILYAIQTTGSGHLSRALSVNRALVAAGHQVDALLSGPEIASHWDLSDFARCQHYPGLSFVMVDGKVSSFKTLQKLRLRRFYKDVKRLDLAGYDLVLNDFEPISAWAAKRQSVPSLALSNQASFRYPIPKSKAKLSDRFVMKYFAPCERYIGLGWDHFGYPILPPVVDIEALQKAAAKVRQQDFVLVYLPYDSPSNLIQLFNRIPKVEFRCYGHFEQEKRFDNVVFCPASREHFLTDLAACQGLITNAGFASISEALYLGKKILATPIAGQFEQLSNAKQLQSLGLARSCQQLSPQAITDWLASSAITAQKYPDVSRAFASWLSSSDWQNPNSLLSLTQTLWQQQEQSVEQPA